MTIHSPLIDLKRAATTSQLRRVQTSIDTFDFRYLRFDLGRHGLSALQDLARSDSEAVARSARTALAEANRVDEGLFARRDRPPIDKARFMSRIQVFPDGRHLPDDLVEQLLAWQREKHTIWCIDHGAACVALLVDLDDDGQDEVVVPLSFGSATVYAKSVQAWHKVGDLTGRYGSPDELRAGLMANRVRALPSPSYHGVAIGTRHFAFVPCLPDDPECSDGAASTK